MRLSEVWRCWERLRGLEGCWGGYERVGEVGILWARLEKLGNDVSVVSKYGCIPQIIFLAGLEVPLKFK